MLAMPDKGLSQTIGTSVSMPLETYLRCSTQHYFAPALKDMSAAVGDLLACLMIREKNYVNHSNLAKTAPESAKEKLEITC